MKPRSTKHRRAKSRSRRQSRLGHDRPLRFEALEDRRVLAIMVVDSLTDVVDASDGVTSLREAIAAANATTAADTVQFAPALTAAGPATLLLTHGKLAITQSLTITGPGSDLLTLDASGSDPTPDLDKEDGSSVMSAISPPGPTTISLNLSGLRMTGGDPNSGGGGALVAQANVTLDHVIVDHNSAFGGGGIYVTGNVTISNSRFEYNTAAHSAAGAMSVQGNLSITNSSITHNTAADYGGAIDSFFGNLFIDNSDLSYNTALNGGAIQCDVNTSIKIQNSTLNHNQAIGGEAGVFGQSGGGALYINQGSNGTCTITSTTISDNQCVIVNPANSTDSGGGGILCLAPMSMSITNSTISGNSATGATGANGGGVHVKLSINQSTFVLTNSVVENNLADGRGGAIYAASISTTLTDVTIDGNQAGDRGGGIHVRGNTSLLRTNVSNNHTTGAAADGGGISLFLAANVTIIDSSISGNYTQGDQAKGGGIYSSAQGGSFSITRTKVSDNHTQGLNAVGGGISTTQQGISLTDSTISGNYTLGDTAQGGGIYAKSSNAYIDCLRCTLSGNSTAGDHATGGGFSGDHLKITDSTVSGNITHGVAASGGGAFAYFLNAIRSTIARNSVEGSSAVGGGVSARVFLSGSIIALNTSGGAPADIDLPYPGSSNASASLIGTVTGIGSLSGGVNLLNVDPRLGPLTNNGGPTLTLALLPGSPAIDHGGSSNLNQFDQRGTPFLRLVDGDGVGGIGLDIGAFEYQPNPLPGDYNFNRVVDAADYSVWRDTLGSTTDLRADSSGPTVGTPNGVVDQADYDFWKSHFGNTLSVGAGSAAASQIATPALAEPTSATSILSGTQLSTLNSQTSFNNPQSAIQNPKLTTLAPRSSFLAPDSSHDTTLLIWLAEQPNFNRRADDQVRLPTHAQDAADSSSDIALDVIDLAIGTLEL